LNSGWKNIIKHKKFEHVQYKGRDKKKGNHYNISKKNTGKYRKGLIVIAKKNNPNQISGVPMSPGPPGWYQSATEVAG